MRHLGLSVAIALVVLVNSVVLANVWFNRAGSADTAVELTERELRLSPSNKENSGISVQLKWRSDEGLHWFDSNKLRDVGFDCRKAVDAPDAELFYGKMLPRKGYAMMEFAGPSWEAWTAGEKRKLTEMATDVASGKVSKKALDDAEKRFSWEQVEGSRLFIMDVGKDPEVLRKKYPDESRYIIVPAMLRLRYFSTKGQVHHAESARLTGSVERVLTDTIYVSRDKAGRLSSLQSTGGRYHYPSYYRGAEEGEPSPPRFAAVVRYGKHHEPWVVSVKELR